MTLDLNDHNITATESSTGNYFYGQADFTITDSSGNGKISTAATYIVLFDKADKTLTISGGTIESTNKNAAPVYVNGNLSISGGTISGGYDGIVLGSDAKSVTISGGSITALDRNAITNNSSATISIGSGATITGNEYAIQNAAGGSITINGASITGTINAINNTSDSTVKISVEGGTITGTKQAAIRNDGANELTVSDGTITGAQGAIDNNNASAKVTITGGSITYTETDSDLAAINNMGEVSLSGGTISSTYTHGIMNKEDSSGKITISGGSISANQYGVHNNTSNGTFSIVGGTISGSSRGVFNSGGKGTLSGTASISGGTSGTGVTNELGGEISISGVTISGNVGVGNKGKVTLNGSASISGSNMGVDNSGEISISDVTVSGGTGFQNVGKASLSGAASIYGSNTGVDNASGGEFLFKGGTVSGASNGFSNSNKATVDGGTIICTGDTSTKSGINNSSDSELSFLSGTITSGGNGIKNASNGSRITISGGSISGGSSSYGVYNQFNGIVNITDGTISGMRGLHNAYTAGIFNVSGGNIKGTTHYGISNSSSGTFNVSGGTVEGETRGVYNNSGGIINVSGTASISGRTDSGIHNHRGGTISISGGSVTGATYGVNNASIGAVNVSDGTITGNTYSIYNQSTGAASLSGGTYNGQLATKNTSAVGYTIEGTNSPTFTSNTLLSANSTLLKYASGTDGVYLIGAKDWNATTTDNQFFNLSTTDSINGKKDFTLRNVTTPFNVNIDDTVKVAGVPISDAVSGQTPELSGTTDYKITTVEYNTGKTSATVETFENAVSITSAVLGSKVATVSGAGNAYTLYIEGSDTLNNITGSDNNDTLKAGDSGSTLIGDEGSDLLIGGDGADTFVYSAGADSISGYGEGDLVSVKGLQPSLATFTADDTNISLDFGGSDNLTFNAFAGGVSLQSGKNIYTYTKDYYTLNDKGITLAAGYNQAFAGASTAYETIDASAVTSGIFVTGNSLDNIIVGSTVTGGSLYGGAGKDLLSVVDRAGGVSYVFQYTEGKDTVDGFAGGTDSLAVDLNTLAITGAKTGNDRLTLTFSDSNELILKGDALEKISLNSGGINYLTKDGVVSGTSLKLFASAKGLIDLKEDTIYSGAGITSVDAAAASKPITLVGGENGGSFTFAANKKKDLFEYNGGSVTISGYESDTDRINLGDASITGFAVTQGGGVLLSVVDGSKTSAISIAGAQGQEVLIHDASSKSNSYAKMVFKATGVLENKEKRPTEATVLADVVGGYEAGNTIKKVFVMGGVSGVSIGAGNNKTTLDASAANGVSLYGGSKNDKLIGSTSAADMFVYSGGKDEIQNFGENDSISLGGDFANNFENAKITASKRSYKFKFGGKNTLAIKGESLSGAFNINGETKTFAKNAIGDGAGNVSLTSSFSGTYKIDDDDNVNNVDGHLVKKNLTFKGTDAPETFTGGTKKTKFNGGGGNDTLIGNDNGKDTFFYAKGDSGEVTIEKFDFTKDKLKIASNTISKISAEDGGVKFDMSDGSFTIKDASSDVLIKANSTYYWFAKEDVKVDDTILAEAGALITSDTKVKKGDASGFEVIDLGYSTNLVKTNVAIKVANAKPTT